MTPTVSVIITVYNTQKYLREALNSILAQTWRDLELIVIDDGSSDGSLEIIKAIAARDNRIRFISRENRGIVRSSNEGLAMSRGEFVARMDSDDISLPDRLERQVAYLIAHPEIVAVSSWIEYMDEKGRRLMEIKMPLDDSAIQRSLLEGNAALIHGCVTIRRSALDTIGGYDVAFERATEDMDLFLRLGEIGRLGNIPIVALRVRLHSRSIGERLRTAQHEMCRLACERAWKRRGIEGRFTPAAPWRPGSDKKSQHDFVVMCGWWAFKSGERWTAMIYGLKAVAKRPLNSMGWRLLICSIVKL